MSHQDTHCPTLTFPAGRYAAAFSEQLGTDEVFSTRLWGEPLVIYRASGNEVVCVRDACPHRSAPLSMGEVQAPSPYPPRRCRQQHQHHHHHHHQFPAPSVLQMQCMGHSCYAGTPSHACLSRAGRSAAMLLPRVGLRLGGQVRVRANHGHRQVERLRDQLCGR